MRKELRALKKKIRSKRTSSSNMGLKQRNVMPGSSNLERILIEERESKSLRPYKK